MNYKTSTEFTKRERIGDVYTDTAADYSLPDYCTDVRRILFTKADVLPSGKFETGESVEFSGIVSYTVVYVDAENQIGEASFSSDYDFAVKCDAQTFCASTAKTSVSGYSLKLLGPRKISAKAALVSKVELAKKETVEVSGDAFEKEEHPEVKMSCVGIQSMALSEVADREYAEQLLHIDGVAADEVSVVYTDSECRVDSCEVSDGELSMKGEILVRALVNRAEDAMFVTEGRLKFDESIPSGMLTNGMVLSPNVNISSQKCTLSPDENGVSVVVNLIAEFSAMGVENQKISVITDAYMKSQESENSFDSFRYSELADFVKDRFEHVDTVTKEELDAEGIREAICLDASVKLESAEIEGDAVKMTGQIKYSGILSGVDENAKIFYHPFKHTSQFEQNININCQNNGGLKADIDLTVGGFKASVDSSGLRLCSNISAAVTVSEEKELSRLVKSTLVPDTEISANMAKIVVYYPEDGESLFDIAKKFHTTVEKVAMDNSISVKTALSDGEPTVSGVKKLLILN